MHKKSAYGVSLPNLQSWRVWMGLSQGELAIKAGVDTITVNQIEQGRIARFTTIGKLAEALDITRQELMHSLPKTDEVVV